MKPLLLPALLLAASPAAAASWSMAPAQSTLSFTGTETGAAFTGSFSSWQAAISYDPAHPQAAKVQITIDLASAKTGDPQRDEALPGSDWFNIAATPKAVFTATGFTPLGGDKFTTTGTLTLRGHSQKLMLPFTLDIKGNQATAKGTLTLHRTDFGVGQGAWATGDYVGLDVGVSFTLIAQQS
ncbi:YceI family protein [Acidocella sp.]|uniref:YceI family protein n=2 Tax=Acidocella sp. TaxID=50710 RepID=UPI00261FF0BD|nr:YceI family protein [Acidocella sp.]